jgi:hypothetical protein
MEFGNPLLLTDKTSGTLSRMPWQTDSQFPLKENKLQNLIDCSPELLPIREFYPNVEKIVSLGREIPVPTGTDCRIDNLILTDDGHLIIVETKLCKNPGAVREVVAQGLQYAMGLSQLPWEDFENKLKEAKAPPRLAPTETFWEFTSRELPDRPDDFEDVFDRFRRNGDMLLLIVGDVIRPSVERLVGWMNRTIGSAPCKLGLVELRFYQVPDLGEFIVPRTLSKVSEASRHVVTINLQGTAKEQVTATFSGPAEPARKVPAPITDESWTVQIRAKNSPQTAALVEDLRAKLNASGLKSRYLSASVSYGIEVQGDFITLLGIGYLNFWFQLPNRAIHALGDQRFVECKQKVQSAVSFFHPEDVADPTKWASLCPRFRVLDDNVDALVQALNEVAATVMAAFTESA